MKPEWRIGTSGFSYNEWKGSFYPPGTSASRYLNYYSTQFNTVELNGTFYRFPVKGTFDKFFRNTPDDFLFTVKAHKIITHTLRMRNAYDKVMEFLEVVYSGLQHKTGCILFQFPATFTYSEENLENILRSMPPNPLHVIEFRHASWWRKNVIALLRRHPLSICNVSFPGLEVPIVNSSPVFYMRFHGVPVLFQSSYTKAHLSEFLEEVKTKSRQRFIYFNNTMKTAGFRNARTLSRLIASQKD